MASALNTHFQCDGPEGWHFIAKRGKHKTPSAGELRQEVRLLSTPKWLQVYLSDLIDSRAITLCKKLPRPETALLASGWRHEQEELKPTAKRQKISEAAEDQYNPKVMHDGFWQQLKIRSEHCLCQVACALGRTSRWRLSVRPVG